MTTDAFADRLEVSPRTIHRDMDALSAIGIPVYAMRGRKGGWSLSEEYRANVFWMNAREVQAMAVRQPATPLGDLGLFGVADAAWLKLVAGLPPLHRDEANRVAERIHIDTDSWKPRNESTPWLALVKEAMFEDRLIEIRYRNTNDSMSERTIGPIGLVTQNSLWYVVALVGDQFRTYRVSRIEHATMLAERFARPESFNLAEWWRSSKQEMAKRLPRYPTRLRLEASAFAMLRRELRWGRIGETSEPDAAGWQDVEILFELESNAVATVLSLGDQVEVISPPELREAVLDQLRRTLQHYMTP